MKTRLPSLLVSTALALVAVGCGGQGDVVYFDDVTPTPVPTATPTPTPVPTATPTPTPVPTPTPPPFNTRTLRIAAGDQSSISYSIESSQISRGQWCLEYHVDLIQESSRNNLDLDSFINLPTGEIRQVTIDALNSPIQGKVYAESAGKYTIVLDNQDSLFTSKTVSLKTRMYTPC